MLMPDGGLIPITGHATFRWPRRAKVYRRVCFPTPHTLPQLPCLSDS